jgi:anaerobic dimethyl sulfoxide reductase subunit B (iron-sulfur subunit)
VWDLWFGEYPKPVNIMLSASCFHCERPACANVCPSGAIHKREQDGIVAINRNECIGCQACAAACPYGVPQFGVDGRMEKCYLCTDRQDQNLEPACVATCPGHALRIGELNSMVQLGESKGGGRLQGNTKPSVVLVQGQNPSGIRIDFRSFYKTGKTIFHED